VASDSVNSTAERYDLAKNEWKPIQQLKNRRLKPGAYVLDGKIYVFGGFVRLSLLLFPQIDYMPPAHHRRLIE